MARAPYAGTANVAIPTAISSASAICGPGAPMTSDCWNVRRPDQVITVSTTAATSPTTARPTPGLKRDTARRRSPGGVSELGTVAVT